MRLQLKRWFKGFSLFLLAAGIYVISKTAPDSHWDSSLPSVKGLRINNPIILPRGLADRAYRWGENSRLNIERSLQGLMSNYTDQTVRPEPIKWTLITNREDTEHVWGYENFTAQCKRKTYHIPADMKVSIVITYHEQEKLFNVLHTIHSIVQRTKASMLQEIILVDDYGKRGDENRMLESYLRHVFRGTSFLILHMKENVGLIKARLSGIRAATGPVIVCMDSHMEVQERWLEPLLDVIVENKRTLAASYLDWITPLGYTTNKETIWKYEHGGSTWRTYFNWALMFGFQDISNEAKARRPDPTVPINTPVTGGTLFAIDKEFFTDIGEFDEGMIGWGGENIDLPIRVWMCGGRVVNVPCSHVGHKEEPSSRDYRLSWRGKMMYNYQRVVEVFFDEYKEEFYRSYPYYKKSKIENLSQRMKIRQKCPKSFKWYLKNIIPELEAPSKDSYAWGGVMNIKAQKCLEVSPEGEIGLEACVPSRPDSQGIFWSKQRYLRLPVHIIDLANMYVQDNKPPLVSQGFFPFFNTSRGISWIHWQGGPLIEKTTGTDRCLHAESKENLSLKPCDFTNPAQKWQFKNYTSDYKNLINGKVKESMDLSKQLGVIIKQSGKI